MAQIIAGKTTCLLCGNKIHNIDEAIAFPAFVPEGHVFHQFSDGVFHRRCFAAWEHHERFQELYDAYVRVWKSRPSNLSVNELEKWGKSAFDKIFREGMESSG